MIDQRATQSNTEQSPNFPAHLDPLYLFASYLNWQIEGNLASYHELLTMLDHPNEQVRLIADCLISDNPRRASGAY